MGKGARAIRWRSQLQWNRQKSPIALSDIVEHILKHTPPGEAPDVCGSLLCSCRRGGPAGTDGEVAAPSCAYRHPTRLPDHRLDDEAWRSDQAILEYLGSMTSLDLTSVLGDIAFEYSGSLMLDTRTKERFEAHIDAGLVAGLLAFTPRLKKLDLGLHQCKRPTPQVDGVDTHAYPLHLLSEASARFCEICRL